MIKSEDDLFFYYEINLPDYSTDVYVKTIKRPSISYGADNIDNESIFFPSNLKIEFHTNTNLLPYLSNQNITINLYEDEELIFKGVIDPEDVNYSIKQNIYKLTFIDSKEALRKLNYDEGASYLYSLPGTARTIESLINGALYPVGCTVDIRNASLIQGTLWSDPGGDFVDIMDFTTSDTNFYNGEFYKSLWDCIKGLMDSLCMIGYFQSNKLIVTPRFVTALTKNIPIQKVAKQELMLVAPYDYVEYSLYAMEGVPYGEGWRAFAFDYRLIPDKDPIKKITYKFGFPEIPNPNYNPDYPDGGGEPFQTIYDLYAASGTPVGTHIGRYLYVNGVRLSDDYTYNLTHPIQDVICSPRKKIKVKILNDTVNIFDNVTFGTDTTVYRITAVKRDIGANSMEVTGIEIN